MWSPILIALFFLASSSHSRLLPIQDEVLWSEDMIELPLEADLNDLSISRAGKLLKAAPENKLN